MGADRVLRRIDRGIVVHARTMASVSRTIQPAACAD
jgi:hypothetical protein